MREIEKRVKELEARAVELPLPILDACKMFGILGQHTFGYGGGPIQWDRMSAEERAFVETNMERYIRFCEMTGWNK